METHPHSSSAPACSLGQGDLVSRRERWRLLSARAVRERQSTPDGVWLSFDRSAGVEAELRELAALERDCCSFASWSLEREASQLVLRVSTEGEGVAAVRSLADELPNSPTATVEGTAE